MQNLPSAALCIDSCKVIDQSDILLSCYHAVMHPSPGAEMLSRHCQVKAAVKAMHQLVSHIIDALSACAFAQETQDVNACLSLTEMGVV